MWRTLKFMLDRASAEVWQVIVAVALGLLLSGLAAVVLWPAGMSWVGLRLLNGFGLFWLAVMLVFFVAATVQERLRVDLYSRSGAFVWSNVAVSGILMLGWTAYAALLTREAAAAAGLWLAGVLYLLGFLSGVVACQVVGSFYTGGIYKMAALAVACVGFALFAVWPAAARAAFGWLFGLF